MKILALYSMKGGVGKSTIAVNLAYLWALTSRRVLLLDLDAQGASSFFLNTRSSSKGTIRAMVDGDSEIFKGIRESDYPFLDVLPARKGLRNLDLKLMGKNKGLKLLTEILSPGYDTLIMDCPPQSGIGMEAVIRMSEVLLVPLIPTPLSIRTLEMLVKMLDGEEYKKQKLIPFFTMADTRKKIHRESMETVRRLFPLCLDTVIPYAAEFEQMGIKKEPLPVYAHTGKALASMQALSAELIDRGLV